MNHLAKELGSPEILRWCYACERLHANYFHDFMNKEYFEEHRIEVERLFKRVAEVDI